jgi:hypothetical protein
MRTNLAHIGRLGLARFADSERCSPTAEPVRVFGLSRRF